MNKKFSPNEFSDYMITIKSNAYTQTKKLVCDCSDRKNYSIDYRMLKIYVRHGMIVDKNHDIKSFKQSNSSEMYITFKTQERYQAVNDFENDFYKLINDSFFGKTMEDVRNRLKIKFIKKDDTDKISKQKSKLTFNDVHKSYENCDSYTFKQNEVLMDKHIYLGCAVLELCKLLMYETYYDKLQPYFGQKNLQLHSMYFDSFVLGINSKDIIKGFKNIEDVIDFSNLDENRDLYSKKNKKVMGKFKIETPKNF